MATMVGSLTSSPNSLSAAGQDEQPWLVNSSTTARVSATAAVMLPKQAEEASAANARRRAFMGTPHPCGAAAHRHAHPWLVVRYRAAGSPATHFTVTGESER